MQSVTQNYDCNLNASTISENDSGFLTTVENQSLASTEFVDVRHVYTSHNGFCSVYRAQRGGRWWALKALKPDVATDPMAVAMLEKECDIASRFNHRNIARTEGLEDVPGVGKCIVTEWVEGSTLRQRIGERTLNIDIIKQIITQLCDALGHIHECQIVHRDLKPENIMITTDGNNVKLIDMGSADGEIYATVKLNHGTRNYAAPEQLSDHSHVDSSADVWALGCIARELAKTLPWWQRVRLSRIARRCTHKEPRRRCSLKWVKTEVNRSIFTTRRKIMCLTAMLAVAMICLVCSAPATYKGLTNNIWNVISSPDVPQPQAVDLGLSVKWADRNVDATAPEDFGSYFAYGDLKPKVRYTHSTQRWYDSGKWSGPVDGEDLMPQCDVARVKWDGNWRMPTYDELMELITKCRWQWTRQGGTAGYRVTGPSGQSIFLPAAGLNKGIIPEQVGTAGFYLTSTSKPQVPGDAMEVDFYSDGRIWHFGTSGSFGMAVRPVRDSIAFNTTSGKRSERTI